MIFLEFIPWNKHLFFNETGTTFDSGETKLFRLKENVAIVLGSTVSLFMQLFT